MHKRDLLHAMAAGVSGALGAWAPRARAQDATRGGPQSFPTRPVRIVVGVAPGVGTIDLTARAVAGPMAEALGQPVVVDNRPGAGGILAAELVARSTADGGHTLFLGGADTIVHAFLLAGRPPLDPFTDFTPIARATRGGGPPRPRSAWKRSPGWRRRGGSGRAS
jgi:tripartite-type tricarboxylate transporter receptor subunit TctC